MEKLQQILIEFEDLINKQVEVEEILEQVEELKAKFEEELDKINQEKLDAFVAEGGEPGNFSPTKLPEQAKFNDLVFVINERKQKKEEAIAAEYAENLAKKKALIKELRYLIENEEHIGKAFDRFNEIRETWKSIGNVSSHDYKPLQNEYSNLLEAFFYNINIYKELKEHDLKRNLQLREELISKMEELLTEEQIKNVQSLAGTYLSEWDEIGPVHKDEWTRISDKFKTITKKVFDRVKDHYNQIKEQREVNLNAKKELLQQASELLKNELNSEKSWKKATETLLEIQKKWKKIGFATKKENDKIWEDFRAVCDKFFADKEKFYDKAKSKWDENKTKKEELIEKAEELKTSTEWKNASNQLIYLQKEWKKIGATSQRIEQTLWRKFRAACDHFFEAKKQYFDTLDDRLAANLKAKEEFIKSIATVKLESDLEKARETVKELVAKWNESGMVAREKAKDINSAFNEAIDNLYKKLGDDKKIDDIKFEDKIEVLSQKDNSERALNDELQFIKSKMDVLTKEKLQYENNLSFLGFSKGKAADKMRDDVNAKIAEVDNQINEWNNKLRMVKKALREATAPKEENA